MTATWTCGAAVSGAPVRLETRGLVGRLVPWLLGFGLAAVSLQSLWAAETPAPGAETPPPPEGAVVAGVTLAKPPQKGITLTVSPGALQFRQEGRPGWTDAHQTVTLRVSCPPEVASWQVRAQAGPLVRLQGGGEIPAGRLFIRAKGMADFVPMSEPIVVAAGAVGEHSTSLDFGLLTAWEDRPGVYRGEVTFLAVVNP